MQGSGKALNGGGASHASIEKGSKSSDSRSSTASSHWARRWATEALFFHGKGRSVQERAQLSPAENWVGSVNSGSKISKSFSAASRRSGALSPLRSARAVAATSLTPMKPPASFHVIFARK